MEKEKKKPDGWLPYIYNTFIFFLLSDAAAVTSLLLLQKKETTFSFSW